MALDRLDKLAAGMLRTPPRCRSVLRVAAPPYCPFHDHPALEIVHHLSGAGVTRMQSDGHFSFAAGDTVIYPARLPHDQTLTAPGEDLCLQIDIPAALFPQPLLVPASAGADLHAEFTGLAYVPSPRNDVEQATLTLRAASLLLQLVQAAQNALHRPTLSREHLAEQAFELIRRNFRSLTSMGEVAAELDVSEDYLRHRFTQRYGFPPKQHLIQCRIEHAKELLRHSPLPLKHIARLCGFDNERYFSMVFHRLARTTPGRYRQNSR